MGHGAVELNRYVYDDLDRRQSRKYNKGDLNEIRFWKRSRHKKIRQQMKDIEFVPHYNRFTESQF
jgi:hypothetical protein